MSGLGRGRGWLRLGQNAVVARPGIDPKPNESIPPLEIEDKGKHTTNSYNDLVGQFKVLNIEDDGIAINHKIHHIRSEFMKNCPDANSIREAVITIYEQCLLDEDFAQKVLLFITSAHFENKQKSKEQINWKQTVKRTFIQSLQKDFEDAEVNKEKFPSRFYGSIKLCSNFFCNTFNSISIEKISTMGYLRLLLKYNNSNDILMISYLICRHYKLFLEVNEATVEMLNEIKLKIISTSVSESQRFHLFFIYQLLAQNYQLTDDELNFYKSNMNEADFADLLTHLKMVPLSKLGTNGFNDGKTKKQLGKEARQTYVPQESLAWRQLLPQKNYRSPDENASSVTFEELDQSHGISREPFTSHSDFGSREQYSHKTSELEGRSKGGPSDKLRAHPSDDLNVQERVGRPILGIGARLKKNVI